MGKRIQHFRILQGLPPQDLADMLDTDRQYIWSIENGRKNITCDYLDKVIKVLNLNQEDFFPF